MCMKSRYYVAQSRAPVLEEGRKNGPKTKGLFLERGRSFFICTKEKKRVSEGSRAFFYTALVLLYSNRNQVQASTKTDMSTKKKTGVCPIQLIFFFIQAPRFAATV